MLPNDVDANVSGIYMQMTMMRIVNVNVNANVDVYWESRDSHL
jgi:hypothetical protein